MPDARTLRLIVVAALLHLLLMAAIQSGLARRVAAPQTTEAVIADLFSPDPAPRPAMPEPALPREAPRPVRVIRPASSPRPAPAETARAEPGVEAVRQAVDASHAATADAARAPAAPAAQSALAPSAPSASSAPLAPSASRPVVTEPAVPGLAAAGPRVVRFGEIQCSTPEPKYPLVSRRVGEQGTARVRLVIDETGATERAELVGSSGFDRLDRVALDAAQATRCHPYLADGRPIRVTAVRPFAFRLD